MIDHILEHLDLADAFAANAARVAILKSRSRHSRDLIRRCREAAERHRAEAAEHAVMFGIDPQVVRGEQAEWRRLRRYRLDRVEALTVADIRWLKSVIGHGRPSSRNVRRAAELLLQIPALVGVDVRALTGDGQDVHAPLPNTSPFSTSTQQIEAPESCNRACSGDPGSADRHAPKSGICW